MKRRIYILDGREIDSSECDGFLHTARTNRGDCLACGKAVEAGSQYVILNYYDCPDPFHLECFIADHPEHTILGIRRQTRRPFGLPRNYVICQDFSQKENP